MNDKHFSDINYILYFILKLITYIFINIKLIYSISIISITNTTIIEILHIHYTYFLIYN